MYIVQISMLQQFKNAKNAYNTRLIKNKILQQQQSIVQKCNKILTLSVLSEVYYFSLKLVPKKRLCIVHNIKLLYIHSVLKVFRIN